MDLLKKLTQCFGPSGNEEEIREFIKNEIKNNVDDIKTDALGNLIARKKGPGKRIMFAAHMDEIGLIATFIDKNGFIRFSAIGGIMPFRILYQKVSFKNGTVGIVSYEEKLEKIADLTLEKMYIDIGAKSREQAEEKVNIGDAACFMKNFNIEFDTVSSKALDNRIGCYILIETIKSLTDNHNDLYFVFTVQEELGLRGAGTSAYSINPDYAIAVDITGTGDTPESKLLALELGKGPAIKVKDSSIIAHPVIKNLMIEEAKNNNLPYQLEVLEQGGTDSGAIHITRGGVPSGVLSIPIRYIHTSVEKADINDIKAGVKLLTAISNRRM
jgi:putative aminopeptidase FrvX